ncbi:MAG: hypothetical protein PHE29_06490 [Tissierellia bacterium]|nr:hypothetical protein [Tissierellia bacterium]MDD4780365.1 hypothetical protein [Tissierellia bacterium]
MKNKLNLEVSLLEIILSILIFVICSVIVINCFIIARYTQIKANDKTIGIMKVQTTLEYIRSSRNIDEVNEYMIKEFQEVYYDNNIYINYYDKNWNICDKSEKEYIIKIKLENISIKSGKLINIQASAQKIKPYPLVDKNRDNSQITLISTNKFFPNFMRSTK